MRLGYDLIVFDLEANQPSGKIIEIGAVKLTRIGKIEESKFQSFVNPDETINDYIVNLCQLSPNDLNLISTAPSFDEALRKFYEWATKISKNVVLCSWGNYDIAELKQQTKKFPFRGKSVDAKSIAMWVSLMFGRKIGSESLEGMLKDWNVQQVGQKHRALFDAYNTASLLQAIWEFHETMAELVIDNLKGLGIK